MKALIHTDTRRVQMEHGKEQEHILDIIQQAIPYFFDFFEEDISFALTDREKYLFNQGRGKLKIDTAIHTPIPKGGAAEIALKTGQQSVCEVPEHVYGTPFKSYAMPIKDEYGAVCGCLLLAKDIERNHRLQRTSNQLANNMAEILQATNQLAEDVQIVLENNKQMEDKMKETVATTRTTGDILKFIQGISNKTKLLGLNASIEAARAGEAGRGFAVVAKEIEKMSGDTNDSVKKISTTLHALMEAFDDIHTKLESAHKTFENQASMIEEIVAAITELEGTTTYLDELANQL